MSQRTILWMSTLVGILLLILAGRSGYSTYKLITEGVKTTGTIIAMKELPSSDGRTTFYAVVRFTTREGKEITFQSSVGSNYDGYSEGKEIWLVYPPENPKKAQLNGDFGAIWLALLGLLFTFIGIAPPLATRYYNKKKTHVLHQGRPITALITGIRVFGSANAMGCSPYHIVCKWHDPSADKIHVFESEDIYFDPKPYIHRQQITVYVNDNNMKNYYVDISFLPELA